jgi:predicted CopG family antitoxin
VWLSELTEYATISVPVDVKKRLEKVKGKKEWGEFLLELYTEAQQLKSKKAFQELTETLTEEDLKSIAESTMEFREKFAFR